MWLSRDGKNSLLDYKYSSHSTKVKVIFAITTAKNDLTEYITQHTLFLHLCIIMRANVQYEHDIFPWVDRG